MRTPKNLKKVKRSVGNFIGKLRTTSDLSSTKSSAKSSTALHFDFPEKLTTPRADEKETDEKGSEKTTASGETASDDVDFVTFVRSVSTTPSVREAKAAASVEDDLGLDRYDSMYPDDHPAVEEWDTTTPAPMSPVGSVASVVVENVNSTEPGRDMKPLPSPAGIASHFSSESEGTAPDPTVVSGVLSASSMGDGLIPVLLQPPIQSGIKTMNPTPTSLSADAEANWSVGPKQRDVGCKNWYQAFSCL